MDLCPPHAWFHDTTAMGDFQGKKRMLFLNRILQFENLRRQEGAAAPGGEWARLDAGAGREDPNPQSSSGWRCGPSVRRPGHPLAGTQDARSADEGANRRFASDSTQHTGSALELGSAPPGLGVGRKKSDVRKKGRRRGGGERKADETFSDFSKILDAIDRLSICRMLY